MDDAVASATAQLRLLLVQRFSLAATISLFPGADIGSSPEAAAAAAAAAAEAVVGNATLLRQLAAAFNASLAPAFKPLQLSITAVSTSQAAAGTAAVAGMAPEAAAVAAAGPVQALSGQRRRVAQAPAPVSTPALQLTFSLDALSPNPLLYAGGTAPTLPPAAASQLQLQSVDAAFADSLQQTAAAACTALAAVLAGNCATAAALQGAGGSFSCSPPAPMGSIQAITPAVSFDAASWLPGELFRLVSADGEWQCSQLCMLTCRAAAVRCSLQVVLATPPQPAGDTRRHRKSSGRLSCTAPSCRRFHIAAVLGALSAADQQLQALRAALAASAASVDSGQQLAAIASAWGNLMTAYNGSQVRPGASIHCHPPSRLLPRTAALASGGSLPAHLAIPYAPLLMPTESTALPACSLRSCPCLSCKRWLPPCKPPPRCWACRC